MVKGERSGYRQDPLISVVYRYISLTAKGKEYETCKSYSGRQGPIVRWAGKAQLAGQAETPTWRAGKTQQASRDPHPGGQRPSPARAPTRTSRRAGIGQGDLPHTKVTTSSLRMQGDHKEQHRSHSLNQWKERFDLWHRHAGILTGSEPYKLRGILNKEPRSLMTRFGPSSERGPGTQPHIGRTPNKIVSEFSVRICYIQYYNVFYQKEDKAMVTTMYTLHLILRVQCHNVFYREEDNLPLLWYLENVKFWNESKESKESKESVKCFCEIFRTPT